MTPVPCAVSPTTPVRDVARMMAEEDVGPLPVVDGDRLIGIVTDRDLVVRVLAEDRDPASMIVIEVATPDPVTVEVDEDLARAVELMALHQVRRLPVVENGRLIGILAQADVAKEVRPGEAGSMLADISRSNPPSQA
jgi:CBS domain-containing protein